MDAIQPDLFGSAPAMPAGFAYAPDVISAADESRLVDQIRGLPFKEFEFHGYLGKRRVVSFGWRYNDSTRALETSNDIPDFLLPIRDTMARFAKMAPEQLQQILVTEYSVDAGIGHRHRTPRNSVSRARGARATRGPRVLAR